LRAHKRIPKAEPLARFLGSFFAAWQRMNIKNQSAQREPKARSMSVWLRRKQKIFFAKPAPANQPLPSAQNEIARAGFFQEDPHIVPTSSY
jgi:hypothetical protein